MLIFASFCQAQNLSGSYAAHVKGAEGGRKLTFNKGKFTDTTWSEGLGIKTIGEGTYKIATKKMVLNYNLPSIRDSSYYKLNASVKSGDAALITVNAQDESGKAAQVQVGIRSKNDEPLAFFYSDENGIADFYVYEGMALGYFVVDLIGYHRISIPIAPLLGKSSKIFVRMKPQQYIYLEPKKVTYDLTTYSSTKVELSSKISGSLTLRKN